MVCNKLSSIVQNTLYDDIRLLRLTYHHASLSLILSEGESSKVSSSRVGRVGVVSVSTPRVTDDRGPRRAGSPSSTKKKSYTQERDDEKRKGPRDSLKVKNTSGRRNSIDSFLRGRGSLKKRDKNRDKRMKEERALERRTIRLPE
jgi:hypothetical protein